MNKNLTSWLRQHTALLALLLLSFIIYLPSLSGSFVVDDVPTIQDNPYIRDSSHIADFFTRGVWENSALENAAVPIYRPMYLLAELLNHQLWGGNPVGYHIFLLLLHLSNACLVYFLIRKLVAGSALAATMGAAVFALHPARVESVAWLSGITDPQATFFLLGALIAHRLYIENRKGWGVLALSLLCFQLALWSKEVAIVFPLLVAAHDLIFTRKINWRAALLHAVLVAGYLLARGFALGDAGKPGVFDLSNFSRAIDFTLGYSELLALPAAVPFYLQPPEHAVSSVLGIIGAILIVALAGFSWRVFNEDRKKVFLFSVVWISAFSWPAILMMFYGEGYYSARFLYVPAVGVAIFAATLYSHLNTSYPILKTQIMASGMLIIALYGIVTWKEIPAWHDDEAIYGKVARLSPESAVGYSGLGHFYMLREDYAAAEKNYLIVLQKHSTPKVRVEALVALGTMYGMTNNFAPSARYLQEAVQIEPKNSEALAGLGNLALLQGQLAQAISYYEQAIAARPTNYEATMNLATAYEKAGQPERGALLRRSIPPQQR